jgi:hypothetical protein
MATKTTMNELDSLAIASLSYIRQRNMPSGWIEENYPNKWPFTVVDIIKSGDLSTFDNTEIDSIQNLKQSLSKDQWDNLKLLFLDYSKHVEIAKRQNEEAIAVAAAKKREEQKAAISAREFVWREKLRIKEARMGFDSFTYEDKKLEDRTQESYDFNSFLVDSEIQRHKEQLGVERVVVSTGTRAQTFHIDLNCTWMWSGRTKSSKYADLPDIAEVSVEDAVRVWRRRPCNSCFDFWWRGETRSWNTSEELPVSGYQLNVHDRVLILEGPFNSLVGTIAEELSGKFPKFRVIVSIFGKETPVELDASVLKPID